MTGHRLPPLNALRAFEATARHSSVKKAADELCVTPGAVSQLIKALELHLGVALFQRVNRGMALTGTGRAYLPPIRNAFQQIAEATARIAAPGESGMLTVSVTPSFAATWLVPRLKSFQEAHPDIDLQVMAGKTLVDFARDGVDVAVRHGLGRYPGLVSERLFTVELVAVAAPELVAERGLPAQPSALADWPQVHDAERKDWHLWFQAQGIASGPPRGPAFEDSGLLLKAVLVGQGAGLLPVALAALDLAAGRLVRLAEVTWPEAFAYYLVYPEASRARPNIVAFRDWILAEAGRDDAAPSGSAAA